MWKPISALRPSNGTVAVYGSAAVAQARFEVLRLMRANVTLRFVLVYDLLPRDRERVLEAIARHSPSLQRHIAERYPLAGIAGAHQSQESGRVVGNIVVLPGA